MGGGEAGERFSVIQSNETPKCLFKRVYHFQREAKLLAIISWRDLLHIHTSD